MKDASAEIAIPSMGPNNKAKIGTNMSPLANPLYPLATPLISAVRRAIENGILIIDKI